MFCYEGVNMKRNKKAGCLRAKQTFIHTMFKQTFYSHNVHIIIVTFNKIYLIICMYKDTHNIQSAFYGAVSHCTAIARYNSQCKLTLAVSHILGKIAYTYNVHCTVPHFCPKSRNSIQFNILYL